MTEVIVDTSAIQYLHQIGQLRVLSALYESVLIPPAVHAELARGRKLGVNLPLRHDLEWSHEVAATAVRVAALASDLGDGEREVIALGLERAHAVLLLDDRLARQRAEALDLRVRGTLRVLVDAKKTGLVTEVRPLFNRLHELGFRMASKTFLAALRLAGEELE